MSITTTGQRIGQGFSELASSTEALYKFGKVVSSAFRIVTESLKFIPGTENIGSHFSLVEGQVNTALKVMGATHIVATAGKWAAEGEKNIQGKNDEETASLKREHNFHTAQRVFLLIAQSIETILFIDKATVNFFDQAALKLCNVSILELVKSGLHVVASVCGLGKTGVALDRTYKEEKKIEAKLQKWKSIQPEEETKAPEGETAEAKKIRETANAEKREKNEKARASFSLDRIYDIYNRLAKGFSDVLESTKDQGERLSSKMTVTKTELGNREQAYKQAQDLYNARLDDVKDLEAEITQQQTIVEKQQAIIDGDNEEIKNAARAAKEAAEFVIQQKNERLELLKAGQPSGGDDKPDVIAITSTAALAEAVENAEQEYLGFRNALVDLYERIEKFDYKAKIEELQESVNNGNAAIDGNGKDGNAPLTDLQLQEITEKLERDKIALKKLQELNARVERGIPTVETNIDLKCQYKIDKYKNRLHNCKQDKIKSWISIVADIAKIFAIVVGTTVLILSFFFPVLTVPAAVLAVTGLGFISNSIGLTKNLYNATASGKKKEISYEEYLSRETKKKEEPVKKPEK